MESVHISYSTAAWLEIKPPCGCLREPSTTTTTTNVNALMDLHSKRALPRLNTWIRRKKFCPFRSHRGTRNVGLDSCCSTARLALYNEPSLEARQDSLTCCALSKGYCTSRHDMQFVCMTMTRPHSSTVMLSISCAEEPTVVRIPSRRATASGTHATINHIHTSRKFSIYNSHLGLRSFRSRFTPSVFLIQFLLLSQLLSPY